MDDFKKYIVATKNELNNISTCDVKIFDIIELEKLYPGQSMKYLVESFPEFKHHFFLYVNDIGYYTFNKHCMPCCLFDIVTHVNDISLNTSSSSLPTLSTI